jgi:hypothetical protein
MHVNSVGKYQYTVLQVPQEPDLTYTATKVPRIGKACFPVPGFRTAIVPSFNLQAVTKLTEIIAA